jgi:hypothetical protein
LALAVVVQQERTAADAARLRLDQTQHHLHGDGRVDGRAASFKDCVTRVGGQRMGCSYSKVLGRPAGFVGVARRCFGLQQRARRLAQCRGRCRTSRQQGGQTRCG